MKKSCGIDSAAFFHLSVPFFAAEPELESIANARKRPQTPANARKRPQTPANARKRPHQISAL
ncbi:hypothetical protein VN24_15215 [Paenibacillus beijingensis]|uniref:Uncharacterized protein n=1 Tax=Paenibacillus beijingensis TaxID=1126833 RepID=A0A0D5NKM3_9BACL|nr:hypothetical protein VN24_15215 [Paenibacillus beijingensis]